MPKKESVIEIGKSSDNASPSPHQRINKRLGDIEGLTRTVLWVGLITLVGVVVAVAAMILDQEHFNNETYREQSASLQVQIETLQQELNSAKSSH